jgi:hypothetical protein
VYSARERNGIYIPRDRYFEEEAEKKVLSFTRAMNSYTHLVISNFRMSWFLLPRCDEQDSAYVDVCDVDMRRLWWTKLNAWSLNWRLKTRYV